MSSSRTPTFEVCVDSHWATRTLVDDVRRGLGRVPRRLSPKWLYDDRGSELFDQITRLPEYYPTEREREILKKVAPDIVQRSQADILVELGSGTSDKTRVLLDAFAANGHLAQFVPVDVSVATLRYSADQLSTAYPGLAVHGIVGDFTLHLASIPKGGRRLVAFLGSTIGNLFVEERQAFLGVLADVLNPGDSILLGTDLVKQADRLIAAYNDPQGITAEFVGNILAVLNTKLGANFNPRVFSYVPFWDPALERMDLRLRVCGGDQLVDIPGAGLTLDLHDGEEIRVEISSKFREDGIRAELEQAGFSVTDFWTDPGRDFALSLATLAVDVRDGVV